MVKSKQYYGIFFDVLGQKDFMSGLRSKRDWERGAARMNSLLLPLLNALRQVEDQVRQWAKVFPPEFAACGEDRLTLLSACERIKAAERLDLGIKQFSDSTLLCVDAANPWSGFVLSCWLHALASYMLNLRARGLYLRGAVSVGEAYPVRFGKYIGPLIDELESLEKEAFSSRIIFSSNYLAKHKANHEDGKKGLPYDTWLAEIGVCMVEPDIDGVLILNDIKIAVDGGQTDCTETLWYAGLSLCEKALYATEGHKAW